jgi:hypothetical protein
MATDLVQQKQQAHVMLDLLAPETLRGSRLAGSHA